MGIVSDNPAHEGYLRGYVAPDTNYPNCLRELGEEYGRDKEAVALGWVAMACECGWRSPRWRPLSFWHTEFRPGVPTERRTPEWVPSIVEVSPTDEEIGRILWVEHDRQCAGQEEGRDAPPIARARELARARLTGPSDGVRFTWNDDGRTRRGRVISTSLRDRSGKNTHVQTDDGTCWIDSRAIVELLP